MKKKGAVKKYAVGGITQPGFKSPGKVTVALPTPAKGGLEKMPKVPNPKRGPVNEIKPVPGSGKKISMPTIRPGKGNVEKMPKADEPMKMLKKGGMVKKTAKKGK